MLGQHGIHHPAVLRQIFVAGDGLRVPIPLRGLKDPVQPVGHGLVRTEDPEVFRLRVELEDIPHKAAQLDHILGLHRAGGGHGDAVIPEIRQTEIPQQLAAVGMGVCAHPPVARGGNGLQRRAGRAVFVKKLLGTIAPEPLLHQTQMLRFAHIHRHLMGPEGALDLLAVGGADARPALGRAEHDHGPAGPLLHALLPGLLLGGADIPQAFVQRVRHHPVGGHMILAVAHLHKVRLPAAALEELLHLVVGDAGKDGGVGDLIAVQVQDGQHRAIGGGVQEFIAVPRGGQRAGLRFAVAHNAGGDQIGIVEHRAKGVGKAVAQLAALMDGARRFRSYMAGDAAGEGKLLEQPAHALLVLAHIGIDLAVGAVQPVLGHHGVAAVAGPGEIDHVQVILTDQPVQMGIDKVLAGDGTPMAHDLFLDVFGLQGLPQQGIVQQIELPRGKIIGCAPPGVQLLQHGFRYHSRSSCIKNVKIQVKIIIPHRRINVK